MDNPRINGRLIFVLMLFITFAVSTGYTKTQAGEKNNSIFEGKLIRMFKSGGYVYLEYESGDKKHWVASKTVVANIGDTIRFRNPLIMKKFHSKTLNKTFETIYFAGLVRAVGKTINMSAGNHPRLKTDKLNVTPGTIQKVSGGFTIKECFEAKNLPENRIVSVRAVVVKVSSNIKGLNWVHLRDGSGVRGKNELILTTKETVKRGDIVLVNGKLIFNKDIGAGYIFPRFMDEPKIIREEK